jgi:hypothetical protein
MLASSQDWTGKWRLIALSFNRAMTENDSRFQSAPVDAVREKSI